MCCTRLAENTGRKNYAKNRYLRTIGQLLIGSRKKTTDKLQDALNANV